MGTAKEAVSTVLGKEKLSTDGWEPPSPKHPVDRYGVFSPHQVLLFSCRKLQDAEKYCAWYDKKHNVAQMSACDTCGSWSKSRVCPKCEQPKVGQDPIHCTVRLMYGIKVKSVQLPKSIHEVWDVKYHPDDDDEIYIPYSMNKWEEAEVPKESKCDDELLTSPYAHNK